MNEIYRQGASCVNVKQSDKNYQSFALSNSNGHKENLLNKNIHNTLLCKNSPRIKPWTLDRARSALLCIPPNINRIDFLRMAGALKTQFRDDAKGLFLEWSAIDKHGHSRQYALKTWGYAKAGIIPMSALRDEAKARGWTEGGAK